MSQDNSNDTPSYSSDLNDKSDSKSDSSVEDTNDSYNEYNSELIKSLNEIPGFTVSLNSVKKSKFSGLIHAGASRISFLAEPVRHRFGDQLEKADKIAAASVGCLTSQVPIVINTIREPAIQTFTTVKQYQSQLGCTIEDNIKTPGSRFALKVDSQLEPFVNVIEDLLKKYILDENGETNREIQDNQQQIIQTFRVLQIAAATRDRCVEKVKQQLFTTQCYTADQLKQLQESNQLLSRATETVNALNQSLLGMVVNLRETVQNPDLTVSLQAHLQNLAAVIYKDEENLPKAVQARIIDYSSALLAITDSIGSYIKLYAQHSPEYLQERLKPLVTFFEERYSDVVNEIKNGKGSPIDKAKNILQLTTNHTLPLLRSSLTDLQEAIHCYTNSLNTSFHNQINNASQVLNVK